MKTIRFIFVAATMSSAAFSADITLNDGRVFKDASIGSQTPRKVTIKHTNGLSSVGKELLPTELQAQYPINEAAARAADEKAIIAREAALNARNAETERLARVRTEREATASAYQANQTKEAAQNATQTASVSANARLLAERYFEKDYSWVPSGSRSASVTIDEVRPVDGIAGRWFVTGRAVIKISPVSSPQTMSSFQLGGDSAAEWRQQYNENQFAYQNQDRHDAWHRESASNQNQPCPTPSTSRDEKMGSPSGENHPHESHRPAPPDQFPSYRNDHYVHDDSTIESRNFEAYYSTESWKPTIDVTVR